MSFLPRDILCDGAFELGIELTERQLAQMDDFAAFLVKTNEKFNLTRITGPQEVVTDHYLDSLTCLAAVDVPLKAVAIDVGTGAGFPGIPIKIARPDIHMTLLDATAKKVQFLSEAIERLGLREAEAVHGRAEALGRAPEFRERYDAVFARALSEMRIVAELCLPLARVGGNVVAQKSRDITDELAAAEPVIDQLGGRIRDAVEIRIPHSDITRRLVVIEKLKVTPARFPRPYSVITRKGR